MDKASYSWIAELVKSVLFILIVIQSGGDWFKLSDLLSAGPSILISFVFLSVIMSIYFHRSEPRHALNTIASGI